MAIEVPIDRQEPESMNSQYIYVNVYGATPSDPLSVTGHMTITLPGVEEGEQTYELQNTGNLQFEPPLATLPPAGFVGEVGEISKMDRLAREQCNVDGSIRIKIPVITNQVRQIKDFINGKLGEADYDVVGNNCSDFVKDALKAAGVDFGDILDQAYEKSKDHQVWDSAVGAYARGAISGIPTAIGETVEVIKDRIVEYIEGLIKRAGEFYDAVTDDPNAAAPNNPSITRGHYVYNASIAVSGVFVRRGIIDPLVLDLNGDGTPGFVGLENSNAFFDLNGDGARQKVDWIDGEDGFLVNDINNNNVVDGIGELFGSYNESGVVALARLDSNGDGVFDSRDRKFSDLKIWKDANQDGYSQTGELSSLTQNGIRSIDLSQSRMIRG